MLLIPLWLLAQNTNQQEPKPYDVDEGYEAFSAALALEKPKGELLLIGDTTVPFNSCMEPRSDKLVDSAIDDYKKTNEKQWILQRRFKLDRPYELLSKEQWKTRTAQRGPSTGVYYLSAVGFSADKTIAFVELDFVCGGLCGHGSPYILQKKGGKWAQYEPSWTQNSDGTMQGPVLCSWYH
jgi:hypothetical protein